ncbi:putative Cystatin domain-containing protein [Dioscorea sansibarensis]
MRSSLLPLHLLLFIFTIIHLHGSTTAKKPPLLGGSHPIKNLKDPHILDIANFAVTEHNKEAKSNLIFQRVIKGKIQVVQGLDYYLILEAKDGTKICKYEAVVWEMEWLHFRNLTSFKLLKKKSQASWEPVKNLEKDVHALEMAEFAVMEHNKKAKDVLVFKKVVSGEIQVVDGLKYRFVILAVDGAKVGHSYEAVVWEKAWLKFKKLTSFKLLKVLT